MSKGAVAAFGNDSEPPVSRRPFTGLALFGPLIGSNLAAWAWAFYTFNRHPALLGTALLAWIFGLRHAVDADHIAAIDNVVRKLVRDGRPAEKVGLWFSLGHSTVVMLASLVVMASAWSVERWLGIARQIGGVAGTLFSAFFLLAIAIANLFLLHSIWRSFLLVRQGAVIEYGELNQMVTGPGLLSRLLRPVFDSIAHGWQMYPLGFVFGLGFDTATEIGVLGLSATQASQGMEVWQIMVFPALFTAGMALVDTADSVLMVHAYGWASLNPLRKLWYNLTITAASVFVALLIGAVELLGLVGGTLALRGPFWTAVDSVNSSFGYLGFAVVGLFILCWISSFAVYRWRGYDRL